VLWLYGTESILALFLCQSHILAVKSHGSIAALFHHRWAVPILAELHRRQGERYAYLAHRFGISRETLSQTLAYLVRKGWVRRNPGYGHPLRPEYLLTAKGAALGPQCERLAHALTDTGVDDLGLRKWTLPILYAMARGPKPSRFSEILATLGTVTPRSLSESLKRMEDADWIVRQVTDEFPPSTRYGVTSTGRRYQLLIGGLAREAA